MRPAVPPTSKKQPGTKLNPLWIAAAAVVLITAALVILIIRAVNDRDQQAAPQTEPSQQVQKDGPVVRPNMSLALEVSRTDFTLPGLSGNISLNSYRGQYVLLNFWATWCPPCEAEMPELNAYYLAQKNNGYTMIGVDVDEDLALVKAYVEAKGYTFPVAVDGGAAVFLHYVPDDVLPSTFLIGPDGRVVYAWAGRISYATLEEFVTPLLEG